jgi:hypothetical protein
MGGHHVVDAEVVVHSEISSFLAPVDTCPSKMSNWPFKRRGPSDGNPVLLGTEASARPYPPVS